MISKTLIVLLGLLMTACVGMVEPAVPSSTTGSVAFATALPPTAAPATLPSSAAPDLTAFPTTTPPSTLTNPWDRAGNALENYLHGGGAADTVTNAFSRAAVDLLQDDLVADDDAHTDRLRDALKQTVTAIKLSAEIEPRVLVIPLVATSERKEIITFGFVGAQGVPIVMLLRQGATIKPISSDVFGAFDGDGKRWAWLRELSTIDVTGDGVNELVTGYVHGGGSSSQNELEILRWDTNTNNFKQVFRGYLVNWVGESNYTFLKHGQGNTLQISFPWFGAFSAKMIDHVRATEEWTYDAATDVMVRGERSMEPARTVLQQLNVGEKLFRDGELDLALRAFERAATDSTLIDPPFGGVPRATRGFAHFRQGQILAVLGRETEARAQFAHAKQIGGSLAALTDAYLKGYISSESALRAWGWIPERFDIEKEFRSQGEASNLDFPANPSELLFQGGVIAAYLNSALVTEDALEQGLYDAHHLLLFGSYKILDWNDDGRNEALVTVASGSWYDTNIRENLWLVYQREEKWRARKILDPGDAYQMRILDPFRHLPDITQVVSISWQTSSRHEQRFSWDGQRLRRLDLESLEPLTSYDEEFKVGTLPEPIDF